MKELEMKIIEGPTQWVNFQNASPEALGKVLEALNTELEEAKKQNRFPTVEGALKRLGSFTMVLQ